MCTGNSRIDRYPGFDTYSAASVTAVEVAVARGVGDAVAAALADDDGMGVGLGVAVGLAVGVAVAVGVGVAAGVTTTPPIVSDSAAATRGKSPPFAQGLIIFNRAIGGNSLDLP